MAKPETPEALANGSIDRRLVHLRQDKGKRTTEETTVTKEYHIPCQFLGRYGLIVLGMLDSMTIRLRALLLIALAATA